MKEIHNKKVLVGRKHIYSLEAFFSFWEDNEGYHAELFVPKLEKTFRVLCNDSYHARSWLWREAHEELSWHAKGVLPREEYGFAYAEFKASKPKQTCLVTFHPGSFEDRLHKLFEAELERTGAEWYHDVSAYYDHNKPDWYYDHDEDPVNPGFSVDFWRSRYVVRRGKEKEEWYIIHYGEGYLHFMIKAIQWLRSR